MIHRRPDRPERLPVSSVSTASSGKARPRVSRGLHLEAPRRHGRRVRSRLEGEYAVPAHAVASLEGQPAADVVLFCVKTYDSDTALATIRPVVGPDTAVLSLQNGIDNTERIDAALGPGHALGGAAYVFATLDEPGVVVHRFGGRIVFGELDGRASPRSERLREAFVAAGIAVELS